MKKSVLIGIIVAAVVLVAVVSSVALGSPANNGSSTTTTTTKATTTTTKPNDHTHVFGAWKEISAASCTVAGEKIRICSTCSYAETRTIAALGHTTNSGTCSRCKKYFGTWTKEKVQNIIQIHDIYVSEINSADGVDMRICWTNTSDKTIKYIHFYVEPYNAVNDKVTCDIRDHSLFDAWITGPCEPGYKGYSFQGFYEDGVPQYRGTLWENCWYNSTVRTIDLVGIEIIYMDGTEIVLDSSTAKLAFAPYQVDQTVANAYAFFDYYSDDEPYYIFNFSLDNSEGINLKKDVYVDIIIVNDEGLFVYSNTFEVKSSEFYEGSSSWEADIIISEQDLNTGDTNYGKVFYKVYNSTQGINLEEKTIYVKNLPITDYLSESILYLEEDTPLTLYNSEEGEIVINSVEYEFVNGFEYGQVTLYVYFYAQRVDNISSSFLITGSLYTMDDVYVTDFSTRVYVSGLNASDDTMIDFINIEAGEYYIVFDDMISN